MTDESDGPSARPLDETVAETGPGIADEAVAPGELGPADLDPAQADRAAAELRERGWVGESDAQAEAESEAHPS